MGTMESNAPATDGVAGEAEDRPSHTQCGNPASAGAKFDSQCGSSITAQTASVAPPVQGTVIGIVQPQIVQAVVVGVDNPKPTGAQPGFVAGGADFVQMGPVRVRRAARVHIFALMIAPLLMVGYLVYWISGDRMNNSFGPMFIGFMFLVVASSVFRGFRMV